MVKRMAISALAVALTMGVPGAVWADMLTNGDFSSNTGNGQVGYNTSVTGWSVANDGYTFLFGADGSTTSGTTADNGGATGQYGNLQLWGPGNGSANGLINSPVGGAIIGQDSAFQDEALQQTVSGLAVGDTYQVGFWWAAAQQYTFYGGTYSEWNVSLGSDTQSTGYANIASNGFSGWMYQTFTFTASSTSETLSFLADGGPTNPSLPPFALLAGVTFSAVPEPSSIVLSTLGLIGVGAFSLRRRSKAAKA